MLKTKNIIVLLFVFQTIILLTMLLNIIFNTFPITISLYFLLFMVGLAFGFVSNKINIIT